MFQIFTALIFLFIIYGILKNLKGKGSSSYFNESTRRNDPSHDLFLHNYNTTDLNGDGISDNMKHSAHIVNENTGSTSDGSNSNHDSCDSASNSGSCDCGSSND